MSNVTITKEEYKVLKKQALEYKRFAGRVFSDAFADPVKDITQDFKRTGLYKRQFLSDLEIGLNNLFKSKEWRSK